LSHRKKTDVADHPQVIDHVGLLFKEPSTVADCSLFSHPKLRSVHSAEPQPNCSFGHFSRIQHIPLPGESNGNCSIMFDILFYFGGWSD